MVPDSFRSKTAIGTTTASSAPAAMSLWLEKVSLLTVPISCVRSAPNSASSKGTKNIHAHLFFEFEIHADPLGGAREGVCNNSCSLDRRPKKTETNKIMKIFSPKFKVLV